MKVLCFRYPRNAVTDVLISLLCIFIITLILLNADYRKDVLCGNSDNYIVNFLDSNGWQTDAEQGSVKDIIIPEIFDETYTEYALLQKSQGFAIENYKGKQVTVYTYPVKNYPGYEDSDNIFINIIVYDNAIIGADVLCTSINGFITGAVRNGDNQT